MLMQSKAEPPPLLVRADADARIGVGHVMRCLALAEEWHRQGGEVAFLSCRADAKLRRKYQASGATASEIRAPHPASADLVDTIAAIRRSRAVHGQVPWVALDGYHFDTVYHRALRAAGCRLLVLDDCAHLPYYDADIILNHGVHAREFQYPCAPDTLLLLASRFALLRREFQLQVRHPKPPAPAAQKILVTLGGSDPVNASAKVMQALARIEAADLTARILIGPANPHGKSLRKVAAASPYPMTLEASPRKLAPLMRWADLAVTAAGGTCWELAAMGVPMITLVVADNQRPIASALAAKGAAMNLGWHEEASIERIGEAVAELKNDPQRRTQMSANGRALVDGRGVGRVFEAMWQRTFLQTPKNGKCSTAATADDEVVPVCDFAQADRLALRPANKADARCLWQWANDPVARGYSFDPKPIPWPAHEKWFSAKMASPDCRIWILEFDHTPVGQIRYERTNAATAQISFSVAPGQRRRSFGTEILCMSVDLAGQDLGVKRVRGYTFEENLGSIKAFTNAGFVCAGKKMIAGHHCWVFHKQCLGASNRESRAALY